MESFLQKWSLLLTVLYSVVMFILGKYIVFHFKQISNDIACLLEKKFKLVFNYSEYIMH